MKLKYEPVGSGIMYQCRLTTDLQLAFLLMLLQVGDLSFQ